MSSYQRWQLNVLKNITKEWTLFKKKTVKFEHFLRANFNPGGKTKYYITFAARESDSLDEPLVEYQAKVAWCAGKTYPILCRPSSSPPKKIESDGREQMENLRPMTDTAPVKISE